MGQILALEFSEADMHRNVFSKYWEAKQDLWQVWAIAEYQEP